MKLSIAIPTYNRADILFENINLMAKELLQYDVEVYIYDDSDNENVKLCVEQLIEELSGIKLFYSKNEQRLGYDGNCRQSIMSTPGDFIWYLGDGMYIESGTFSKVIKKLESNPDAIIFNSSDRCNIKEDKKYDSIFDLYGEIGWHITLAGVIIYNSNLIEIAREKVELDKYNESIFMQLGILYESCLHKNIAIEYVADSVIVANTKKRSSFWVNIPIEIWVRKWFEFNMMLPDQFSDELKLKVVKEHDKYTGCLSSIWSIVLYKSSGTINLKEYNKYKKETLLCLGKHKNIFILSMYIPGFLFKIPQFFINILSKIKNRGLDL